MIDISKIDNRNISITIDNEANNYPASYEALQAGNIVIVRSKKTLTELLRSDYTSIKVNGTGYDSANETQIALNEFIGNFNEGGETPTPSIHDKGYFPTPEKLAEDYPTGEAGDWAIVGSTDTIWVWDTETEQWVDTHKESDIGITEVSHDSTLTGKGIEDDPLGVIDAPGSEWPGMGYVWTNIGGGKGNSKLVEESRVVRLTDSIINLYNNVAGNVAIHGSTLANIAKVIPSGNISLTINPVDYYIRIANHTIMVTQEVHLVMNTTVAVTYTNPITWIDGVVPILVTGKTNVLVFRYTVEVDNDGTASSQSALVGNLAYTY